MTESDQPNELEQAFGGTPPAVDMPGQQMLLGVSTTWDSPYPPPAAMQGYEHLLPGATERVFSMVERDQAARIRFSDSQVKQGEMLAAASVESAKTGQAFAGVLALICVVAAIVFFGLNKPVAGFAFLGLPSVLLIRSFLLRR